MFKKQFLLIAAITSSLLLTGCMPAPANQFSPSFSNVTALQTLKQNSSHPIQLMPFTASVKGQRQILCRLDGPIGLPHNQTFHAYIYNALRQELAAEHLLADHAPVVLNGTLEDINFDSFGNDSWYILMTFTSNHGVPFTVASRYKFQMSGNFLEGGQNWDASAACTKVAQEFVPAVQAFLQKLYQDKHFMQLFQSSTRTS